VYAKWDQWIELTAMLPSINKLKIFTLILLFILIIGCSNSTSGLNGSPAGPSIETQPTVLPTDPEKPAVETSQGELPAEPGSTSIENIPATHTAEPKAPKVEPNLTPEPTKTMDKNEYANVLSVEVNGDPGKYSFSVGIQSLDTGCDQYADWWEVIDLEGGLIYRRILAHSHVGEQPFSRSGGPVPIEPDKTVIVRAHMNNSGYGGAVYKGSISSGFEPEELEADFAIELEGAPPLPDGCAF